MRVQNWVEKLHDAIEAASKKPFDYGDQNCGLFAAQCIDAIVEGSNRVEELQSQFNDMPSALKFVRDAGSIEAAVTARLGEPSWNWAHARRGDVCLMPTPDGPGLGICAGVQVIMMAPEGVTFISIAQATRVWRID